MDISLLFIKQSYKVNTIRCSFYIAFKALIDTALHSNFDPSHFKNKKCLYELFFQHFFQISRNQRMEIQNHQPEKCLVFKKYLKKCYFQTIEVLEIPWVKIATESCVITLIFMFNFALPLFWGGVVFHHLLCKYMNTCIPGSFVL